MPVSAQMRITVRASAGFGMGREDPPARRMASLPPGSGNSEIDSMDPLNLMIGLYDALGIDIPEADPLELSSLHSSIEYVAQRLEDSA